MTDADKQKIIIDILVQLSKTIEFNKKSLEDTRQASIIAPSRMETRYDAQKEVMAQLAEAQEGILLDLEQLAAWVQKNGVSKIFETEGKIYLLTDFYGGKTFETSLGKVTLVSKISPFGKKLNLPHSPEGNPVGDEIAGEDLRSGG